MKDQRALTLWQPWASLIAVGAKQIETRSWSTDYRGPLLIHAAKRRPPVYVHHNVNDDLPPEIDRIGMPWEWTEHPDDFMHGGAYRWAGPLGAIVATCTLIDVWPTEHLAPEGPIEPQSLTALEAGEFLRLEGGSLDIGLQTAHGAGMWSVQANLPYGDFTPGRFGWLLGDVKPTTERCPACLGGKRIADVRPEARRSYGYPVEWRECPTCNGEGACDPISAKGKQGLWNWTPDAG